MICSRQGVPLIIQSANLSSLSYPAFHRSASRTVAEKPFLFHPRAPSSTLSLSQNPNSLPIEAEHIRLIRARRDSRSKTRINWRICLHCCRRRFTGSRHTVDIDDIRIPELPPKTYCTTSFARLPYRHKFARNGAVVNKTVTVDESLSQLTKRLYR